MDPDGLRPGPGNPGDLGDLELSDILDSDRLRSMLESFYRITGMLGAVLDLSGKILVAVGWQDICTHFHRCHPATLKNCLESDTALTAGVPVGTFKQYRCKNNMWDMVTPLHVAGRHVGNIFVGQFFYEDEEPDRGLFRQQARRYGFNEEAYLAALDRVPRFSREAAQAGMEFYAKLTSMVSDLSYSTIKVSKMLDERIHLEEQLRQAQKMEVVGQLAGGIAHDFNNVLQVINGYSSLLKMDPSLNARQREQLDHIASSAMKAAQLTKGLLAFSRKQVMSFSPVSLAALIESVRKLLTRIIGEDIHLRVVSDGQPLDVWGDPGQLEQTLINLATNARDAMPGGGTLTIETGTRMVEKPLDKTDGPTAPGCYAVITVSDTGAGMDKETRTRIFEPFFTTKEVGKGTGLGLAIVYGIIQQHNGTINVYSEPGQGTAMRVYLPLYHGPLAQPLALPRTEPAPRGGTETIVLGEDDADVRQFLLSVLTQFGYSVILAVDGQDVVDQFAAHLGQVSLVLMDMIMPKRNGRDAYAAISALQPGVKVLYVSGYTADFIQNRGVSGDDIKLVMKPVQPTELLRKVREMLDN